MLKLPTAVVWSGNSCHPPHFTERVLRGRGLDSSPGHLAGWPGSRAGVVGGCRERARLHGRARGPRLWLGKAASCSRRGFSVLFPQGIFAHQVFLSDTYFVQIIRIFHFPYEKFFPVEKFLVTRSCRKCLNSFIVIRHDGALTLWMFSFFLPSSLLPSFTLSVLIL